MKRTTYNGQYKKVIHCSYKEVLFINTLFYLLKELLFKRNVCFMFEYRKKLKNII